MRKTLLAAALVLGVYSPAFATTITFSPLAGPNSTPYAGHVESGYSVTPSLGNWSQAFFFGNPIPAIFSISVSASVDVAAVGGGLFQFNSVEMADAGGCSVCATFVVTGLRSAVVQFAFGGTTTGAFVPYSSAAASGAVIDTLRITMNRGALSYNIDNIDVSAASAAVPEPGTLVLLGTGLAAALRGRRRQR